MDKLRQLIHEILTPSARDESSYDWSVIALGHVMLGAAVKAPLGTVAYFSWPIIVVGYWLAKERGDLKRGGSWRDGLVDTGFVAFGALYDGVWWWPITAFALVALGLIVRMRNA